MNQKNMMKMLKKAYPELSSTERKIVAKKLEKMNISDIQAGSGIISKVVGKVKNLYKRLKNSKEPEEKQNNNEEDGKEEDSSKNEEKSDEVEKVEEKPKKPIPEQKDNLLDKGLKVASKVIDKVTGCKDKEEKWDYKVKAGEKHQIFLKDGCSYRGRFSGPGTRVVAGMKELMKMYDNNVSLATKASNFVSDVDRTAFSHDLAYLLASREKDQEKAEKMVRQADLTFIRVLKRLLASGKEDKKAVVVPLNAMKAKVAGEKLKIIKVYGINSNEHATEEDYKLAEKFLAHLKMLGFGKNELDEEEKEIDDKIAENVKFSGNGRNMADFLESHHYQKFRPERVEVPRYYGRCFLCDKVMTIAGRRQHIAKGVCTKDKNPVSYTGDDVINYLQHRSSSEVELYDKIIPSMDNKHVLRFLNTHPVLRVSPYQRDMCHGIRTLRARRCKREQIDKFITEFKSRPVTQYYLDGNWYKEKILSKMVKLIYHGL